MDVLLWVEMKIQTNNLNFDIDLDELLGQGVDLDETRVDCTVESTKLGYETNVSLANWLVWVRADDTTWNGSEETDAVPERVNFIAISNDVQRCGA